MKISAVILAAGGRRGGWGAWIKGYSFIKDAFVYALLPTFARAGGGDFAECQS